MSEDLIADLHHHLEATQELPVERTASRWIGEAEAVTADLVDADVSEAVVHDRVGHVRDLLDNVATTEQPEADEHIAAAKRIAADLLSE